MRPVGVGACLGPAVRSWSQGDAGRRWRNSDAHRECTRRDSAGGVRRGRIVRRPAALVRRDHAERRARRSFEIQVASSCVAPLYQALFSRERLEVRIAPPSGERAVDALSLDDAHLTRVELSTAANERGTRYPLITLELTASRVIGAAARGRGNGRPSTRTSHRYHTDRASRGCGTASRERACVSRPAADRPAWT